MTDEDTGPTVDEDEIDRLRLQIARLGDECARLRFAIQKLANCNVHDGHGPHCTCSQRERMRIASKALELP